MPTKQHSPVGWIRRSRRIRHEQRAQNPPSLRLNPFRHFRPLTAKDLRYLLIGLAPEGKIGVWLEKPDKPNIRLTDKQILIETVSGEKMEMCKGISRHDFSLGDDEYVLEFIKDKKYPYGNW